MKKEKGIVAITIGIICIILAFVMTVQLRTVKETDITLIENMREDELKEQAEVWKQKYEETQSKIDEDNKKINEYKDALPYLERRIGMYCSYCEFPITHVPEVEQVVSKSSGGEKLSWSNLLLSCKYCNSTKKNKTTPENANDYLWPDQYNTALAFRYDNGIPQVNEEKLKQIDQTGVYLQKVKNLISVWMYVFEDETEILRQLVKCFPGTKEEYFDANGRVKEVIK